jgi:excinuclease UvrABC nuclease subunit
MARKIINQGEYSLHIVASEGGVIIVKVFNRKDGDILECSIFTEQSEALTEYIGQYTTKTKSILNFLNTI